MNKSEFQEVHAKIMNRDNTGTSPRSPRVSIDSTNSPENASHTNGINSEGLRRNRSILGSGSKETDVSKGVSVPRHSVDSESIEFDFGMWGGWMVMMFWMVYGYAVVD